MNAATDQIEALRARANIDARAADLAQFRADFKAVFAQWRSTGKLSEQEASEQYRDASAAVQEHMHDPGWMRCAASHFRSLAVAIQIDTDRSDRIRAEVRAEKEPA